MLLRTLWLLPLMLLADRARGGADSTAIEVFIDGVPVAVVGSAVTIPADTSALRFAITPAAPRVRYQFEGLDKDWREHTDVMLFIIRFLNPDGDQISQEAFPVTGASAGWKGSVEKSSFTPRRERITVPAGAGMFSVVMSSAGPAAQVGVFAVSGINIRKMGGGNGPDITYMEDSRIPRSRTRDWNKSGTHPSMATARNLDKNDPGSPVLIITDDDVKAHADWNTGTRSMPKVAPGEILEIDWKETYCSGLGGPRSITYERLPAGSYRFIAEGLSVAGAPVGARAVVSVKVPRPYWQSVWFWAAAVAMTAVLSVLGGRYLIRKKINRHLRHAQLIADERLRIARDLHDDLGTRLSHISLLGAHAAGNSQDEETRASFGQITAMSRELISALSETVWMLNPKNNELEALVDFLCRLVSELCRLAQIRCRIDAMSVTENVPISHEFRHNLSLAVKEIVNNALKHSFATEVRMTVRVEGRHLRIVIADNGVGISAESGKSGLGLTNITQRMDAIRGKCTIDPHQHDGLSISLEAPIT